ncbi:MAG: rRNA maturation RNase YbeY [Helicobacteraceae bacterium]|jgi:probable rRNA maturation factor|nr:rRNA maturation RNase YbeY [Helicobacteraceae bacterium]
MIDFANETDFSFDPSPLETIAQELSDKRIELILIDDDFMRELNSKTRGICKTTDVLSFPIAAFAHSPLGSIAISIDTAAKQAKAFGHSVESEIAILFLHGLLHLLGLDHEKDNGEMALKEAELRARFNLPIVLTER